MSVETRPPAAVADGVVGAGTPGWRARPCLFRSESVTEEQQIGVLTCAGVRVSLNGGIGNGAAHEVSGIGGVVIPIQIRL